MSPKAEPQTRACVWVIYSGKWPTSRNESRLWKSHKSKEEKPLPGSLIFWSSLWAIQCWACVRSHWGYGEEPQRKCLGTVLPRGEYVFTASTQHWSRVAQECINIVAFLDLHMHPNKGYANISHVDGDREAVRQNMRGTWCKWVPWIALRTYLWAASCQNGLAKRMRGGTQRCLIYLLLKKNEEEMILKRSGKFKPQWDTGTFLLEWLQSLLHAKKKKKINTSSPKI